MALRKKVRTAAYGAEAPVRAAAGSVGVGQFLSYMTNSSERIALTVPTISRAHDLIASIVGAIPFKQYTRQWTGEDYEEIYLPLETWMDKPDPKVTRNFILVNTFTDLYLYGRAFWYVTTRYSNGFPASFTFVTISSRTISDFMTLAAWSDTLLDKIAVVQNGDASWLNSGVPSGFTAHPSLAVVYHPTATEHAAEAYAAILSAVDADVVAPAGWATITGIDTYDLTATQAGFAAANFANALLPLRDNGTDRNIHHGYVSTGERVSAVITRAWTAIKIEAAVADLFASYYAAGRRLPLDARGEAAILSILSAIGAEGLAAGHYTTRADLPDGYAFATSIDAGTLTIEVSGQYGLLDKVEAFSITLNLTRS